MASVSLKLETLFDISGIIEHLRSHCRVAFKFLWILDGTTFQR
jgi:hypothetical protein